MPERDPYEVKMRDVLRAHLGHIALVNDYDREVTPSSIEPESAASWNYRGFAVHCTTCDVNLSQQWN